MSTSQLSMLVAGALVICGGAYVHGVKTDRWQQQTNEKLEHFSQRMEAIPIDFGDWTSKELDVNEEQFEASHCDRAYSRVFVNSVTGEQISAFLVSGRGYHVTIHTPEFCYTAAGYEMGRDPTSYKFEAPGLPENEVLHSMFKKDTQTETSHLRILWTYSKDGMWQSPEKLAKYTFGDEEAVYKLYLIRNVDGGVPAIGEDPALAFAREFLPILSQTLFAP